jgi:hypothetical protein
VKSFADGKIDVYLGPVDLGAADNLEQAIVDFIGGARKSEYREGCQNSDSRFEGGGLVTSSSTSE